MRCAIKLFAQFRENRFISQELDFPDQTTVKEILLSLDIDPEEVGIVMVNSRHCTLDQQVVENDALAVFPAIGGG